MLPLLSHSGERSIPFFLRTEAYIYILDTYGLKQD